MMRVAWNLLWLRPGVVGGSEEYATRQLEALVDHGGDDVQVTAFVLEPFVEAHPALAARVDCRILGLDGASKPRRVAAETSWLASGTRRGFDLVHHLGGRVPAVASRPRVLTVHDLQPLEQPENFSAAKRMFLARALPRSVARSDLIVTPSAQVARRVVELLDVDPARVRAIAAPVVTSGVPGRAGGHSSRPAEVVDAPPEVAGLLARQTPFFLYPAITYPHKNHATLLAGFAEVRQSMPEARLVLSGGAAGREAAVERRMAAPDLAGAVIRLGRVERAVLDALVDRATALVFPSEFEGFGLPVVEAMAAGCPVIVSDLEVLREVARDAAVFVRPDDPSGWARAMLAAAAGEDAGRTARGRVVAAGFRPEATSASLVDAYRGVVGS